MKTILQEASRRLFPLYGRYRAHLRAADAMQREARVAYRDAQMARLGDWAAAAGIDFDNTTTKADVRDRPERHRRKSWWPTTSATTGGTTGAPLVVQRALDNVVYEQATIDHVIALQGVDFARARRAVFRADSFKAPDDRAPPFWQDRGATIRTFSTNHLDRETAPSILAALAEFRPEVIYCYPTALELLLVHVRELQVEIRPKLVLTSSEFLPSSLHAEVRAAFDCALLDYYGQAERVCFAWSVAPVAYQFRHDYGLVELDRADRRGIIIGTGFHNRAQLLPHYDTGDEIIDHQALDAAALADIALGLRSFEGISGRTAERMILPSGRQIIGFNHMPRSVTGADFVQFLRTGDLALDVHVVKNPQFSDATIAEIERNVRAKVPVEVATRYVFGSAPLRTPRGKSPIYIDGTGK